MESVESREPEAIGALEQMKELSHELRRRLMLRVPCIGQNQIVGANQSQSVRSLIVNSAAHTVGIFIVAACVFVVLRYADKIMRRLGPTGSAVLLRLSAFILLCIGVQIIWNGASTLFRTLAFQ